MALGILIRFILASGLFSVSSWGWDLMSEQALDAALDNPHVAIAFIKTENEPRSRNLEGEWAIATAEVNIPTLAYGCESKSEICQRLEGKLPDVVFFRGRGSYDIYRGPRSATAIQRFLERMQRPAVSRLEPSDEETFRGTDSAVCLAKASPQKDEGFITAFEDIAKSYRTEFTFGLVPSGDTSAPSVACHRPGDGKSATFEPDEPKGASLESFVLEATRQTITDLTPHNHQRLLDRRWPMIYLFGATLAERNTLRQKLHGFAASYPDLTTVLVDPLDFPDLPAKLGLEPGRFPAGAVHQLTTDKIWPYPYGKDLESKSLQQWGLDVWQGRVKDWKPEGVKEEERKKAGGRDARVNQHIKIANIPGLEKLRAKYGGRDEL